MSPRTVSYTHLDRSLGHGGVDDGDDVAQVLARGEFGDNAAVVGVERDLRRDDVGEDLAAAAHHRRGGLIAGTFNAENKAAAVSVTHVFIIGTTTGS